MNNYEMLFGLGEVLKAANNSPSIDELIRRMARPKPPSNIIINLEPTEYHWVVEEDTTERRLAIRE